MHAHTRKVISCHWGQRKAHRFTDMGADTPPPPPPLPLRPPRPRLMQSQAPPGPQRSNNTSLLSQTCSCLHIEMCYQGRRPDSPLLSPQVSITSGFTIQAHILSPRLQPASQGRLHRPPGSASFYFILFYFIYLQTELMSGRLVPVGVDKRSPSEGTNWAISHRGNLGEQQAHTFNKHPPPEARQGAFVGPNGRPADTQSVLLTNVLPAQAAVNEKAIECELNGGHLSVGSFCQRTTPVKAPTKDAGKKSYKTKENKTRKSILNIDSKLTRSCTPAVFEHPNVAGLYYY